MAKRRMSPAGLEAAQLARLRHIRKLARIRHPDGIPANRDGALLMLAMAGCGLDEAGVRSIAPAFLQTWDRIQADVLKRGGLKAFTADSVGNMVSLLDAERTAHRLWTIRPCDVDWHVVQQRRRQAKSARQNNRNKERRAALKAAADQVRDLDVREEALLSLLTDNWQPVSQLEGILDGGRAWRDGHGKKLTGNSLRRAVHRAADRLVEAKRAQTLTIEKAGKWKEDKRFIRKCPCGADLRLDGKKLPTASMQELPNNIGLTPGQDRVADRLNVPPGRLDQDGKKLPTGSDAQKCP
jgi:hypothetical protein